MIEEKAGGFKFRFYATDHRPYHFHILKDRKYLGKFDIENQKLELKPVHSPKRQRILSALRKLGYLSK